MHYETTSKGLETNTPIPAGLGVTGSGNDAVPRVLGSSRVAADRRSPQP
jgi:hypothetical protein